MSCTATSTRSAGASGSSRRLFDINKSICLIVLASDRPPALARVPPRVLARCIPHPGKAANNFQYYLRPMYSRIRLSLRYSSVHSVIITLILKADVAPCGRRADGPAAGRASAAAGDGPGRHPKPRTQPVVARIRQPAARRDGLHQEAGRARRCSTGHHHGGQGHAGHEGGPPAVEGPARVGLGPAGAGRRHHGDALRRARPVRRRQHPPPRRRCTLSLCPQCLRGSRYLRAAG